MAMSVGLAKLAIFNPDNQWLSYETKWCQETGAIENVPVLVVKPDGLWGWLVRIFYEYVWKPSELQLCYVIPEIHQFILRVGPLAGREEGIDRIEYHSSAAKVYAYFADKLVGREDLLRDQPNRERAFRARVTHHQRQLPQDFQNIAEAPGVHQAMGNRVQAEDAPEIPYHTRLETVARMHRLGPNAKQMPQQSYLDAVRRVNVSAETKTKAWQLLDELIFTVDPEYKRSRLYENPAMNFSGNVPGTRISRYSVYNRINNSIKKLFKNRVLNDQRLDLTRQMAIVMIAHFAQLKQRLDSNPRAPQRDKDKFKQDLTTFITRFLSAFNGCPDMQAGSVDIVYVDYMLSPEQRGDRIGGKLYRILDSLRRTQRVACIREAMRLVGDPRGDFASTVQYWSRDREIRDHMGISEGIAELALGHAGCGVTEGVMKDHIMNVFDRAYTPALLIETIAEHVMGQGNILSSTDFQNWAKETLLQGNEDLLQGYCRLDGKWDPALIARMLEHFRIIQRNY